MLRIKCTAIIQRPKLGRDGVLQMLMHVFIIFINEKKISILDLNGGQNLDKFLLLL